MTQKQDPLIGKTIDSRFKVIKNIGQGGMGSVYLAEQISLKRKVALKILNQELYQNQRAIKRFTQEAQAASKLQHPNTIIIHDFGMSTEGLLFIVMEYLNGCTLREEIERKGHLDPLRTLKILLQVSKSLAEAHSKGIIHRDIKPSNIFLAEQGKIKDFVKVLDFGIAKLLQNQDLKVTQTGTICGTPVYMAPEYIKGEELDARSDIYSLGITMYECLTGSPPFEGTSPLEVLQKHILETPITLEKIHPYLNEYPQIQKLVMQMLAKNRNERPNSTEEIINTLERLINKQKIKPINKKIKPTKTLPTTSEEQLNLTLSKKSPKITKTHKKWIPLAPIIILLLLITTWILPYLNPKDKEKNQIKNYKTKIIEKHKTIKKPQIKTKKILSPLPQKEKPQINTNKTYSPPKLKNKAQKRKKVRKIHKKPKKLKKELNKLEEEIELWKDFK